MTLRPTVPRVASSIGTGLRGLAATSFSGAERALNEDRIRLAVTGLSRAGKTVFITALVQNLIALGRGRDTLPALSARLAQGGATRLRGVEVLPAGAGLLPLFDQAAKLHDLAAAEPSWPPRTENVAQVSLSLDIDRASTLGRKLGPRRVRLDILDYPGEWLLDLPLLSQSFAQWSEQALALLRQSPRLGCAAEFLTFLGDLGAGDRAEESLILRGHRLYREALHRCRREHGLRYLQPGRFICPGPGADAPFLWFFPMAVPPGPARPGSTAALLEQRFLAYQRHVRADFFDSHFAAFDRQVMLVDVLGALCAGRAAFEDTARALEDLASALRYGGKSLPRAVASGVARGASQLLPAALARSSNAAARRHAQARIERVAFVATKADHVPGLRRDNLLHLLRTLAGSAAEQAAAAPAGISHHVAAAILSTTDGTMELGGRPTEVVHGVKLGEARVRPFHVGDVPASRPPEGFWSDRFFELPVFRPPPIDPAGATGIPHLNLDRVLDAVIGDLL